MLLALVCKLAMFSRLAAPCRSKLSLRSLRHFAIKISSLKKQSLITQLLRGNGSPKLTNFTLKGSSNAIQAQPSLIPTYIHVSPEASAELPIPESGRQQEQRFSSDECINKFPSRSIKAYHKAGETESRVGAQSGSKRGIYNDGQLVHTKNKRIDPEKVSVQPQGTREGSDPSYILAESKPGGLAFQMHGPSQESLHISNSSVLVGCHKNASTFVAKNRWINEQSVEGRPQVVQFLCEFEVDQEACYKLFVTSCKGIDWSNCRSVLSFLKELGLCAESRNKMIRTWPSIVKVPVESAMQPTLDFFDSRKLARPTLLKAVESYPRTLCLHGDKHLMSMYELFQHVGLSAREFVIALSKMPGTCPAVDFISQHKYFREQGLSDEAFVSMLRRNPRLVTISVKCLKPKLDFLLHTAKWDIKEIVLFPGYFNYSLKARIIPRFEILEAANLIKRPALCTLLEKTESNLKSLLKTLGSLYG